MDRSHDRQDRQDLPALVRAQAAEIEPWQAAELHLLEQAYRRRLSALNVEITPDVAFGLMVAAALLTPHTPEWGGDARASLAEIALLGLRLLEDTTPVTDHGPAPT